MGIFNILFGKKVTLEIPDENGNIVKRKVSKKFLDECIEQGKVKPIITVHILNPIKGYYTAEYVVGEHIKKEEVDEFADSKGDIYMCVYYEKGEPNWLLLKEKIWKEHKKVYEDIDKELGL